MGGGFLSLSIICWFFFFFQSKFANNKLVPIIIICSHYQKKNCVHLTRSIDTDHILFEMDLKIYMGREAEFDYTDKFHCFIRCIIMRKNLSCKIGHESLSMSKMSHCFKIFLSRSVSKYIRCIL